MGSPISWHFPGGVPSPGGTSPRRKTGRQGSARRWQRGLSFDMALLTLERAFFRKKEEEGEKEKKGKKRKKERKKRKKRKKEKRKRKGKKERE